MPGLRPVRRSDGSPYEGGFNLYEIDPTNTTKIWKHDPVKLVAGFIDRCADGTVANDGTFCGVLAGVRYKDDSAPGGFRFSPYWNGVDPLTGPVYAEIVDFPDMVYAIDQPAVAAQADAGKTFVITMTAGNVATGLSGAVLGAAGAGVIRAMPLTVHPMVNAPGLGVAGNEVMVSAAYHLIGSTSPAPA